MSGECQVNVKSQSELDIGGRETCFNDFFKIKSGVKDPSVVKSKQRRIS